MRSPKDFKMAGLYRVLDANINRLKEGLRVCEEVARFILNDKASTYGLKSVRHKVDSLVSSLGVKPRILAARDSRRDVGKSTKSKGEYKRADFRDIFFANMQRVKESIRVLEEFSKLDDVDIALGFKEIRYDIYELEKKIVTKLSALRRTR